MRKITIIKAAHNQSQIKTYFLDSENKISKRDDFGKTKQWKFYKEGELKSLQAIEKMLKTFANNPDSNCYCAVRGSLDESLKNKTFTFERNTENLKTIDLAWAMLDVDGLACPEALYQSRDLPALRAYLLDRLPEPFKGVSCVFRFSPSMFLTKPNKICAHLWFLLDKPLSNSFLKEYLKSYKVETKFPVDDSLLGAIQIHALGHHPICEAGVDQPLTTDERIALVPLDRDEVETAPIEAWKAQKQALEDALWASKEAQPKVQRAMTLDELEEALQHISPDCSRDDWFAILCSIKSEFGDQGEDLADRWSARGASYTEASFRSTWGSIREGAGKITIATLVKKAKEGGWKRSTKKITIGDKRPNTLPDCVLDVSQLKGATMNEQSTTTVYPITEKTEQNQDDTKTIYIEPKLTESFLAELLLKIKGDNLKYVKSQNEWIKWDNNMWTPEQDSKVVHSTVGRELLETFENKCAKLFYDNIIDAKEKDKAISKVYGFISAKSNIQTYKRIMEDYAGLSNIEKNDMNKDPYLLGTPQGVLDLKTNTLLKTDEAKKQYVTNKIKCNYDPNAKAPRFEKFISEILSDDKELMEAMQRWLGYCLSGDVSLQKFMILLGEGANGKSLLLEIMQYVLGEYGQKAQTSTFIDKEYDGVPTEIARMCGKRLVVADELAKKQSGAALLDAAKIKEMTSGGLMTARSLYKDEFTFNFTSKIMISTNVKPRVKDDSNGFWRRVIIVEFKNKFEKEKDDLFLADTLKSEASGILNWMIEGLQKLLKDNKKINWPQSVLAASNEMRKDNDTMARFAEDVLVLDPNAKIKASVFYKEYTDWCEREGQKPLANNNFMNDIKRIFQKEFNSGSVSKIKGRDSNYIMGINLVSNVEAENAMQPVIEFLSPSTPKAPEVKESETKADVSTQELFQTIKKEIIETTGNFDDLTLEKLENDKESVMGYIVRVLIQTVEQQCPLNTQTFKINNINNKEAFAKFYKEKIKEAKITANINEKAFFDGLLNLSKERGVLTQA